MLGFIARNAFSEKVKTPEFECILMNESLNLKVAWPKPTITHDVLKKMFRTAKPILINSSDNSEIDVTAEGVQFDKDITYKVNLDTPVPVHKTAVDNEPVKEVTVDSNTPATADLSILEKAAPEESEVPVISVGSVLSALAGKSSKEPGADPLQHEIKNKGKWLERADHILDGLWLGDFLANNMHVQMKQNNIAHILTVSNDFKKDKGEEFVHHLIGVPDHPSADLCTHFAQTHEFINNARYGINNNGPSGGVLVHCMAGVSRSATVVIAYIMKELQLNLEEAIHITRSSRPRIYPNSGFVTQMERYERELAGAPMAYNTSSKPAEKCQLQ